MPEFMKKTLLFLSVLCLSLVSCENYFVEKQLDHTTVITDVRAFEYVLEAGDYATIAKNAANIELALAQNDDSVTYRALQQVAKEKAFNELASADMFVPTFIAGKFPQLSEGSSCYITYMQNEGKPGYLVDFQNAVSYTMTADDYKTVWDARGAEYLTPASLALLPAFMEARFATLEEGRIVVLTYNYSDEEPTTLIPDLPYICTVAELLQAHEIGVEHQVSGIVGTIKSNIYGRFYLVDGADSIYVYGLSDEDGQKVWKNKNIQLGDSITLRGKYTETDEAEPRIVDGVYISHSTPSPAPRRIVARRSALPRSVTVVMQHTADGWQPYANEAVTRTVGLPVEVYDEVGASTIADPEKTIDIYLRSAFPYANADDQFIVAYRGKSGTTADVFVYDGVAYTMNTGFVEEVMSFLLKKNWEADISTYYSEPFIGHGQGDFVIQNIALDGLNYVWLYSALYGMKASAYASNTNHATEAWLISPAIRLKKAIRPALIFDQTQKYAADFATECTVWVSTDYAGDVTTCNWTQLPWLLKEDGTPNVPDGGSWTFISSGEMPLTDYIDQTIYIAFKYTSSASASATWEIQNFLVHEIPTEE